MRIITTVLAPALVAGVLVAAAPDLASAGSNLCGNRAICIYDDAGFTGLLGERQPGNGYLPLSQAANDQMSSWENKSYTNGRWFEDQVRGGYCRNLISRDERSYVGDADNDELSGWATNGPC